MKATSQRPDFKRGGQGGYTEVRALAAESIMSSVSTHASNRSLAGEGGL